MKNVLKLSKSTCAQDKTNFVWVLLCPVHRLTYLDLLIDLRCKQQIFEIGSKSVNQSLIRGC